MSRTLALPETIWRELRSLLDNDEESAGVLITGLGGEFPSDGVLLGRQVLQVPQSCYLQRNQRGLVISSAGFVPALGLAADDHAIPLFFHTHPGGSPAPSERDVVVDERLAETFRIRSGANWYGSFILGGRPTNPRFSGALIADSGRRFELESLRVVGQQWQTLGGGESAIAESSALFDRQVRAFGREGQAHLRRLRVGIAGVGGTGSAVAELLIRLGVGELVIADSDAVAASNLSRIHSSGQGDIGRAKVDVVSRLADSLGAITKVTPIAGKVTSRDVASAFRTVDILFGCTDDNAGRAVLSRLAYWYLIPTIDLGVLVESVEGALRAVYGRVTSLFPGAACLICRRRIDADRARIEGLGDRELQALQREGYVPELEITDPSVGAYTTLVAALGVSEMLNRMFALDSGSSASESIVRIDEMTIRRNEASSLPNHYCVNRESVGRGDSDPFLGTVWP